jgi:uncharacterized membrane protein
MHAVGEGVEERIESATGLDGIARGLSAAVDAVVPDGSTRKDVLAGAWLGHPLHPLLTDVVIGAWTAGMLLDLGGEELEDVADAFIALGVAAAVPTALAGLSDWSETEGATRRVGLVHAAGNTTALGLYAASLAARRSGSRGTGMALSAAGGAVATFAGWLGGHLAYRHGVGVDRTARHA